MLSPMRQAPAAVNVYVAPAPGITKTTPAPVTEHVDPAPAVSCAAPAPVNPAISFATPAPVTEHTASARDVTYTAQVPVTEYVDHAPAGSEHVAPAPWTTCTAPVPVKEHVDPATGALLEAAAPVVENVANALADGLETFSWENIEGRQRVSYRTAANWGFTAVTSRKCHPASRVLAIQANDD